jgi:type I restriction enzyme S subunit
MNAELLLTHFDRVSEAPDAVPRLRDFILDLAVKGKLVEENCKDELSQELRNRCPDADHSLPRNWFRGKVGKLLNFQYGKGLPANARQQKGPVPVFGSNGVVAYTVASLTKNPAIIIGRKGSAGALNLCVGPSWTTDVAYFVESPPFFNVRFLFVELQTLQLDKLGKGVKPGLSRRDVYDLDLVVPPLAEQSRIVAKVDELMALCDQLEDAQAKQESGRDRLTSASLQRLNNGADSETFRNHAKFCLDHLQSFTTRPHQIKPLRQTILNLAVRGQLISQASNDEPAARLLGDRQLFLDSEVEPWKLPTGWAWSSFNLIGETLGGGTPSKADSEFWRGSIPWVSPKDMKVDVITDTQDHISTSAIEQSAARLIPTGSLLMVVRGMILAHSFPTASTAVPVTINQDMKAIVPFRPDLIRFLVLLTKGLKPEVLRLVLRSTHGTCKLLTDDLFSLPIPIPPLAEQCRVIAKVDELMAVCDRLETQLTTAQTGASHLLEAVLHQALGSSDGAPELKGLLAGA